MLHFTIPMQHWLLLFPAEFCLCLLLILPTFQQTLNTIFNNVNHIRPPISYNGFLHSSCLRTSIFSAAWLPAWNVLFFTLGILFAFPLSWIIRFVNLSSFSFFIYSLILLEPVSPLFCQIVKMTIIAMV